VGKKKVTIDTKGEDDFGYRVVFEVQEHWVDYKAYQCTAIGENGKEFDCCLESGEIVPTYELDKAEVTVEGYVKWDGCTEFSINQTHQCGLDMVEELAQLIYWLYRRCLQFIAEESVQSIADGLNTDTSDF